MNEFDEFEGELDDGLLEQIDAIEAHHMHVPPARMESVAELTTNLPIRLLTHL